MRKRAKVVAVFPVLAIVFVGVVRAWLSRDLILQQDGRPLALVRGTILLNGRGEPKAVPTYTDSAGRLDLSGVPSDADYINIEMQDDAGAICFPNTLIKVPRRGGQSVVNLHGPQTSSRTTRTYADFVVFKVSW